jgi:hypothetical protein
LLDGNEIGSRGAPAKAGIVKWRYEGVEKTSLVKAEPCGALVVATNHFSEFMLSKS